MLVFATHATAGGVGHDWFADYNWRRVNYPRVLTGVGFCGSTAAFDSSCELFVNGVKMGEFTNLAAGGPTKDHILKTAIPVPANSLIECKVVVDTTTNAANFILEFIP